MQQQDLASPHLKCQTDEGENLKSTEQLYLLHTTQCTLNTVQHQDKAGGRCWCPQLSSVATSGTLHYTVYSVH